MAATRGGAQLAWRKAKRSVGNGACVEVARYGTGFVVRDSKDPSGPVIAYSAMAWQEFVDAAKNGRLDAL